MSILAGFSKLPLEEILDFNQRSRDRWIAAKAQTVAAGSSVLDIGAGTCPYRGLFNHCAYKTHDFRKYDGSKLGGTTDYGQIDYVSDVVSIPVADGSFDVILCTEVLEHVPEPIEALHEITRILKPGGRALVTAPLGSGLHQQPFHYYGGYTPHWYRYFAERLGLEVHAVTPNGGFFKFLAQECARVAWVLPEHEALRNWQAPFLRRLFGQILPRYLYHLDEKCFIDEFTVGYFVEMRKPSEPRRAALD